MKRYQNTTSLQTTLVQKKYILTQFLFESHCSICLKTDDLNDSQLIENLLRMKFLTLVLLHLPFSLAILITSENRVSTRNITCLHGAQSSNIMAFNCEACMITSRNYEINTTFSMTAPGPGGISYACLRVEDVEAYRENLVRECYYFAKDTLSGHDDFCIATPYSHIRGSYRACICLTSMCNTNHTLCRRPIDPYRNRQPPEFRNTITQLTHRVQCYLSDIDDLPQSYSSLAPLCSQTDELCHRYLYDHSVLCAISVDRNNEITRLNLPSSIYSFYVLRFKTQLCDAFSWRSRSIIFSQCEQENTVCMCTIDDCNRDLETCRTSHASLITGTLLLPLLRIFILIHI